MLKQTKDMELELKHIAPYLPFRLKLNTEDGIVELNSIDTELKTLNFGCGKAKELHEIKPLLHPLSKLDLVIRNEFEKYDGLAHGKHDEEIINLFCEENGIDDLVSNLDVKSLRYECVEYMFKNHYDVFSLIPAGLAEEIK